MDTKHTTGPWGIASRNCDRGDVRVATFPAAHPIARVKKTKGLDQWADARLIAAAPDLLAALREVVAISDRKHDAWDKAHAAIAKAEGRAT